MNDFTELENELKKLRPSQPSVELVARIDAAFRSQKPDPHLHPLSAPPSRDPGADAERQVRVTHFTSGDTGKVIRPSRFKVSWIALGAGLAAAAVFLIFARIDTDRASKQTNRVAQNTPAPATRSTTAPTGYIPAGATHVVYNTQDEGLRYPCLLYTSDAADE